MNKNPTISHKTTLKYHKREHKCVHIHTVEREQGAEFTWTVRQRERESQCGKGEVREPFYWDVDLSINQSSKKVKSNSASVSSFAPPIGENFEDQIRIQKAS